LCSQPTGWAVIQMNPRTLGLMITRRLLLAFHNPPS
jgi:hypothetical protein